MSYYLSIFVTATNKQIYLPMPNSSACRGKKQCAQCPKAVDNAIIYASHPRGFHLPARKCEENIIIFLLKGEVLVNSKEYAGTVLHAGEFILQAIGSKYEILAMTDVECVCYRFSKPEFFCEDRYNHIMKRGYPSIDILSFDHYSRVAALFWKVPRPICPRRRFAGKCFVSNGKNLLSFLEITTPTMSFPC